MRKELILGNFTFKKYGKNINAFEVLYPDGTSINFASVNIESIGIDPVNNSVDILTRENINRFKMGISDKLEFISWEFNNIDKALALLTYLIID